MFPYGADIPLKHWPIGTLALMLANIAVYLLMNLQGQLHLDYSNATTFAGHWTLVHGGEVYPRQWVSALFVHGPVWHLLGCLYFLWTFGVVAEGKLGWWFFVPIYLGIGAGANALEQYWMQGSENKFTSTYGAEAALFGIMALALTWFPRNGMRCLVLWFPPFAMLVPVVNFAAALGIWDLVVFWDFNFPLQHVLLHLAAAATGLMLGMLLLLVKIVPGEGWDILSVAASEDRDVIATTERVSREQQDRQRREEIKRRQRERAEAERQLQLYLADDNPGAAFTLYQKLAGSASAPELDRTQLQSLIAWLHAERRWADSLPLMELYVEFAPEHAAATRLKLAEIALKQLGRPAKALECLNAIARGSLPPKLAQYRYELQSEAEAKSHEADLELED